MKRSCIADLPKIQVIIQGSSEALLLPTGWCFGDCIVRKISNQINTWTGSSFENAAGESRCMKLVNGYHRKMSRTTELKRFFVLKFIITTYNSLGLDPEVYNVSLTNKFEHNAPN